MSSRKSSATSRARDWSIETTSSDDMIVFPGNQSKQCARGASSVQMPLRNPILPPPVEKQKDEGFTRFLKKHSSPTHQRVTAGGRIVPIEPRPSPPVFARTEKSATLANRTEIKAPENTVTCEVENGSIPSKVTQAQPAYLENQQINGPQNPLVQAEALLTSDCASSQLAMRGPVTSVAGTLFDPVNGVGFVSTEPSIYTANPSICYQPEGLGYGLASQCGPQSDTNTFMAPIPGPWAVAEHYGYSNLLGNNPYIAQELLSQHCLSAQQSLIYWQQRYDELEQQLRNLDRHRAMSSLDHAMAQQRRILVQQRSDVKDMIQKIKTMLEVSHRTESSGDSYPGGFNVNAPPYIPSSFKASVPLTTNVQTTITSSGIKTVANETMSNEKPQTPGARRPIPIVPPSSVATESAPGKPINDSSHVHPVRSFVDGWGVQMGQAPPNMKREQSAISDTLTKDSTQSPSSKGKSLGSESNSSPGLAPKSANDDLDNRQPGDRNAEKSESPSYSSRLPTQVKDAYTKLLDAMRRPKGRVTKVLVEGQWIDIEGQDLQLQPSALMETWEQDYWACQSKDEANPIMSSTDITGSHLLHRLPSGNGPTKKENNLILARGHQKAATDAFVAQINAIEESELAASKCETQSLRVNSELGRIHSTKVLREVYGTNLTERLNSLSSSNQRVIYTPASSTYAMKVPRKVADDGPPNNADIDDGFIPSDTIGAKGSSSVSIQNIHAVGRLPHNLDGSMEGGRNARGALNTINGSCSPRLVYRPTANGVAWYGPYCREAIERALGNDRVSEGTKKGFT